MRGAFNLTKQYFLVIVNEITTWWGNGLKLWRKAGKEETKKKS